jgi:glycogen synthase
VRILVLTNLYPPHAYGGYEMCCSDVVDGFIERGHDLLVLTTDHRLPAENAEDSGPVERTLPMAWGLCSPPVPWRRSSVRRRAERVLADALSRHRPDVVSVWNATGLPSPLLRSFGRLPQVWVFADAWPEQAMVGDPWLAPAARHRRLAQALGMPASLPEVGRGGVSCFCSAHLRDRLRASMGWAAANAVVTPLGVDRRDFPVTTPREGPGWSWRLLYVGRLDAGKGVDTLIKSLTHLPGETTLTVVGPQEPVHVERLKALVAGLGMSGRVDLRAAPRRRLAAIYGASDVCIFPSEWDEPFGIVPLEAMACGTPVVGTGAGGSREYLRSEENCVLCTPGDPASVAAAVTRLADDGSLRQRVVAGGLRTAASLTVDRLTDQLEDLHREVITAAGSGT